MTNSEAVEYFYNKMSSGSIQNDYQQEVFEQSINALEKNTKLKAEIEQLKAEFEQSNGRIKDKIISRRWKFASDTNPTEAMGMQWANRMNDWCVEIVEEAEQSLKGAIND